MVRNTFLTFWCDEDGAIVSSEIMLIMTILVIGMIVGLKSVRDSVVSELADVAQAFANIDQSFSFSSVIGHAAFTGGGFFRDLLDFCDDGYMWCPVQHSKCVDVAAGATAEASHAQY
jgi:Flp pilus assembly pilin Flp